MAGRDHVHGTKGVWCGGRWVDMEDLANVEASRPAPQPKRVGKDGSFDIIIIGAGNLVTLLSFFSTASMYCFVAGCPAG